MRGKAINTALRLILSVVTSGVSAELFWSQEAASRRKTKELYGSRKRWNAPNVSAAFESFDYRTPKSGNRGKSRTDGT